MNYNIGAYIIFIALMLFIIVYVGKYFYSNGRIFIISLLKGNVALADYVNKLLLVAYCLFNTGFAFVTVQYWQKIGSMDMLVSSLSENLGILVLILACTHYANMFAIYLLSKSNSLTNKMFQL